MEKLRVMIVDDSLTFRTQIRRALETMPEVEIVGTAANGKIAVEKLAQNPADLVTLDLEMPVMDGLQTLSWMKEHQLPGKVIVFTSRSRQGANSTLEAFALGAADFVSKPGAEAGDGLSPLERIQAELVPKVRQFVQRPERVRVVQSEAPRPNPLFSRVDCELMAPAVVVIGSSTGGPRVLELLFEKLGAPIECPIVIAQHMPPVFTATLAERLSKISGLRVEEPKHMESILPGRVYLAPGDYHLRLARVDGKIVAQLDQGPKHKFVRPAVDHLFESAAEVYGPRCAAYVLTGMGDDGVTGAIAIKERGGAVVIQHPDSCIVFGMPGAVKDAGAFDRMENIDELAGLMRSMTRGVRRAA